MTRVDPPYAADEREMLIAFLDFQRESMVRKLEGLSEDHAHLAPSPPANSLLGLIQHLAWVERWWFRTCFKGETLDFPWTDQDPDADFRVPADRSVKQVVSFYRGEWERANEIVRRAPSLDERAAYTKRKDGIPTLRWILNHMIEETARHAGHADITRELVDGSTGL